MTEGKIIKGIAGFYYVYLPRMGLVECKAKGVFRKDNKKPLVGDKVYVDILDPEAKKGNIIEILDRKNDLIRPAVANVDQAILIFAGKKPEPNLQLLDRFLIMMEQKQLPTVLVFNKCDLLSAEEKDTLYQIYRDCGCKVRFLSAKEHTGIEELLEDLEGKTSTVAGPSGVGKSSIINLLQSNVSMETGEISEKIERGKHTTRHSELIVINQDTFILDTPGFSSLDLFDLEKEDLEYYYPEFQEYRDSCRFIGCSHSHEPDCSVKQAVEQKKISEKRYLTYKQLYQELKEKKIY